MRIVAFQAIANRGKVDTSLDFIGIFVTMALDAKFDRRYSFEIDASNVVVCTDLVATQAAGCDCRVDSFPLLFIFMTFQTLAPIDVLFEVDGMLPCYRQRDKSA
jgi:hypothetical protein